MRYLIQGLNALKMSTDRYEIKSDTREEFDLSDFHFTFDSIYLIKKIKKSQIPYIYDPNESKLLALDDSLFNENNYELLSASASTNFLWCLVSNKVDSKPVLLKYSGKELFSRIKISENTFKCQKDLVVLSTDVNTYIFENSLEGIKCLFELKDKKDLEKRILEQEAQLNENSTSSLQINKILINEKIKQFACGKEHVLMLTEKSNQVYSFGIGTKGQLGHSKIENCFEPKLIASLTSEIVTIPTGNIGWHSGALDKDGNCFLWGWNSHGQLGNLDNDSTFVSKPKELIVKDSLTDKKIKFKSISFGSRHTALVDIENNLFTFGWNKYGQLFEDLYVDNSDLEGEEALNVYEPVKVTEFENKVKNTKCGCWFTLISLED